MKKKALSYYLDLIKSAGDRQEWGEAKRYGEIALKNLSKISYSHLEQYLLYSRLGQSYYYLGQYSRSLDMIYTSHLIASKHHLAPEWIIYSIYMLALNFLNMSRINQAINQFQQVEEYYQKYGDSIFPMDKSKHFLTLFGLGGCYLHKGELEKVEEIIQKKLPVYKSIVPNFSKYHYLKGEYLIRRKEYDQARQAFREYIKMNEERNFSLTVCGGKFKLALIDVLEKQLESAISILKNLIKDAKRLKFNDYVCLSRLLLSKCYLLKNMPAKSASIEKRIKPLLTTLDITWFYEMTRDLEQIYRQLQPIYQKHTSTIPQILTDTLNKHYQSHPYANVIIGKSNSMVETFRLIEKVASTDLPILIQGETGTGKELIARAIYNNSLRKDKEWLALNCGAVPETLLENELFGHTKGAFTDAHQDKKGYIELASDGTLFMDEIADMSPAMQQKLLRVLEEKLVWRVGASKPILVNTRFIFASNQNIEELVSKKLFRLDLFHRINTIVITLPPLRDRKEDIPLLINHFLKKYASPSPQPSPLEGEGRERGIKISSDALALLQGYPWPGNVRELGNEIKRIYTLYSDEKYITELMLAEPIRNYSTGLPSSVKDRLTLKEAREDFERKFIMETIQKCNGDMKQTASLLEYNRTTFYQKLKQLKIHF